MLPLRQDRRQQTALKIALGSLIAGLVILWMHATNPFWAPALVIVFMTQYFEGAISTGILRILSTLAGGFFAIFVAHFTMHYEALYVLALCFIIALSVYGFLVYGSGWLNFAVTFVFIYLYLMSVPSGGFDIAYWRLFQVSLAAVAWVLMSYYVFPNHALKDAKGIFSKTLEQYATYFKEGIHADGTSWEKAKDDLSKNFPPLTEAVSALPSNWSHQNKYLSAQGAVESFWAIWGSLGKLTGPSGIDPQEYKDYLDRIAAAMHKLASSKLEKNQLQLFRTEISAIMSEITDTCIKQNELLTNELFNTIHENILILCDNLSAWLCGTCLVTKKPERKSLAFIWHDLRSRPERVRHCVCAGLGCGLVVLIWFTTSWEGGVCAAVSALVVGADFSLQKVNLKIRLRIYGSFTGSLIGMVLVIFVIKNVLLLLICLFVGVLIFGYIATGSFNQMYFSWMATISYVITLIPSNTMMTNFDFALERSVGLIFGLVVMLFVMNFFFQVDPNKVMERHKRRVLGRAANFFLGLEKVALGQKSDGYKTLDHAEDYLREQVNTGDVMAKQTGHEDSWEPIRDILVRLFWCYRYLQKTSELESLLDKDDLPLFVAACQNAQNKLDTHNIQDNEESLQFPKEWEDASAALFFREFNALLKKINEYQFETKESIRPNMAANIG